ncbi:MAG: glycosyltransferase [Syntrophaceae bacterium]
MMKSRAGKVIIPNTGGMKLAIATPCYQMQTNSLHEKALFETTLFLARYTDIVFDYWHIPSAPYIESARNEISLRLLRSDFTDLFFIDSDMEWTLQSFINVLQAPGEVVGTAYRVKSSHERFVGAIERDGCRYVANEHGLFPAKRLPGGFLKVQRSAFESLLRTHKTYGFFDRMGEGFNKLGEDYSFCKRCERAGVKMWLEPRTTITHYGIDGFQGNYQDHLIKSHSGAKKPAECGPLVSIVIACHNSAPWIDEAIQSAMNQAYRNIEVIVVDDGSTDDSREIVSKYAVKLICKENGGVSSARNLGIQHARGEWICCLDGDDMLKPEYVERCMDLRDSAEIIGSWMQELGGMNRTIPTPDNPTADDFKVGNRIHCASLFRRDLWERVGGYDTDLGGVPYLGYEDWDLWLRITELTGARVRIVPEPLLVWRRRPGQQSSSMDHGALCRRVLEKNGLPICGQAAGVRA